MTINIFSPKEFAALTNKCLRTVYNMINDGMPVIQLRKGTKGKKGTAISIDYDEAINWMKNRGANDSKIGR